MNHGYFGEAGSGICCLPLPLNGDISEFLREGTEDSDVPAVDDDFLLRHSGVAFGSFADFDALNKQVQNLTGKLWNLGITHVLHKQRFLLPCEMGYPSQIVQYNFNQLDFPYVVTGTDSLATLFVGGTHEIVIVGR